MIYKTLYYDKIGDSKGIDVNKASASKNCIIFHYWYFLDEGFKVQPAVRNGCHDVVVMSIDLNSIFILNIQEDLHGYIIIGISK